ncbi:hypothetical protein [Nocardia salmonicida]
MRRSSGWVIATYAEHLSAEGSADQLKRHRAVATRYDELAVRYLATVHLAAINIWLGNGHLSGRA